MPNAPRTREPLSLWPQERRVLNYLRSRRGEMVTRDELIGVLYPDPDKEPAYPEDAARQAITSLRRVHGVTIERVSGWRLPR